MDSCRHGYRHQSSSGLIMLTTMSADTNENDKQTHLTVVAFLSGALECILGTLDNKVREETGEHGGNLQRQDKCETPH